MNTIAPARKLILEEPRLDGLDVPTPVPVCTPAKRPRLGFLGVGWIGRHRLEAIAQSGVAEIAAIADPCSDLVSQASALAPNAHRAAALDDLLATELDGIVVATPSALHAEQCLTVLNRGLAVFCQKPLGRSAQETASVVNGARDKNLLLGVDLSYRFMTGTRLIRELCRQGELGEIYAAELIFHNAYGPDKPWFYDRKLSGGGCLIDLGTHLVDLALWTLAPEPVRNATGRLFARGRPLSSTTQDVEDYAVAQLDLDNGAVVQLACSWRLPAGCDAIIRGTFYGSKGGASFRNVNGSFYDFVAERFEGTKRTLLNEGAEPWGGRAAVDWSQRLCRSSQFDREIETVNLVAETLDSIYASSLEQTQTKRSPRAAVAGN